MREVASRKGTSLSLKTKVLAIHIALLLIHKLSWLLSRFIGIEIPSNVFQPIATVSTLELLRIASIIGRKLYPRSCIEIGCGSGYISVALLREYPRLYIIATDISSNALKSAKCLAYANRVYERIDLVQCYSASCIRSRSVDFCYTNPPYLPCPTTLSTLWCGEVDESVCISMLFDCLRVSRTKMCLAVLSSLSRVLTLLPKYLYLRKIVKRWCLMDIVVVVLITLSSPKSRLDDGL